MGAAIPLNIGVCSYTPLDMSTVFFTVLEPVYFTLDISGMELLSVYPLNLLVDDKSLFLRPSSGIDTHHAN